MVWHIVSFFLRFANGDSKSLSAAGFSELSRVAFGQRESGKIIVFGAYAAVSCRRSATFDTCGPSGYKASEGAW